MSTNTKTMMYKRFSLSKRYNFFRLMGGFVLVLLLYSCMFTGNPAPTKKTASFYFIFAPINEEQVSLAKSFLAIAKGEDTSRTRIVSPGNYYRVVSLCGDSLSFIVPGSSLSATSNPMEGLHNKLTQCESNATSLINIMTHISKAANDENLVVLVQAPWDKEKIDPNFSSSMTSINQELYKKKNIRKILLFGIHQNSAAELSNTFEAFNSSIFQSPASTSKAQITRKLEELHNYLKEQGYSI